MAHAFQGVSAELHGNVEAAVRAYRRAKHFGRLANGGDWPATPETDDGTYRHPHSAILADFLATADDESAILADVGHSYR